MTIQDYLDHYTDGRQMLYFLLLAIAGAILSMAAILVSVFVSSLKQPAVMRKEYYYEHSNNLVQRFYEMIFSGASILSFLAIFYLIDRFAVNADFRAFWDKYRDFLLLIMICLSCVFNNYLDHMLIPLKKVTHEERGSVRLLGMLYILLIFFYIKFIYADDNYDGFIMYFLGLMVGRFVYFDASFSDNVEAVKQAMKNLPLLILGLGYTAFMCYVGFVADYLWTSNGVIVSIFFAHLFMVVAIFIVHHSHIMSLFARKPKTAKPSKNRRARQSAESKKYRRVRQINPDDIDEYDDYVESYNEYEEYGRYNEYEEYDE